MLEAPSAIVEGLASSEFSTGNLAHDGTAWPSRQGRLSTVWVWYVMRAQLVVGRAK